LKILDGSNGFPGILKDGNVSDEEASALRYLSGFDHETQKSYIEFGLSGDVSKYLAINSLLTDQIFAKWAVERKFLIQNHKLTDLKINCLKEPEKYGTEVLKSFIDDIKSSETFSDVGDELEKLPEVGEALDKNDMSTNESIEDIVYSILLAKNPGLVRKNLDIMLNEGIPYKRKYCTPLQALEWHYVDNEPDKDNPLEKSDFNLRYFIENVWESSRVSNYYHSERWKNFDEVVDRLNSIDLVSIYMKSNIRYKSDIELYGMENYNASALETFMNKGGDCEDHAMFALYSLIKNGYYYDNFESYNTNAACILDVQWGKIGKPVALGHAVCLYKLDNLFYYLDNCGYKNGPFHTIEDTVNEINPSWKLYQFINENWRITKKVTR
jgi:predicted transglutaminase-like cysteine proteinase